MTESPFIHAWFDHATNTVTYLVADPATKRAAIIDPVFGGLVAFYIVYSAWQIARMSFDMLMDRELPDDERARIRALCLEQPGVQAMHDLRTRAAGPDLFIQLHVEMDGAISLLEAHRISDSLEMRLKAAYPGAEIIIHQDPAGIVEPRASFA